MRDTIINLETVNPIEFFGVNNGKLDILKKKFPLLKILIPGHTDKTKRRSGTGGWRKRKNRPYRAIPGTEWAHE